MENKNSFVIYLEVRAIRTPQCLNGIVILAQTKLAALRVCLSLFRTLCYLYSLLPLVTEFSGVLRVN